MHYYIGDTPGDVSVVPASVQDLTGLTEVSAKVKTPGGATNILEATFDGTLIVLDIPTLNIEGIYTLNIVLSGAGRTATLEPARLVVETTDGNGWHTLDSARRGWSGAPEDDSRLYDLLQTSRIQVLAFAPELAEGAAVPVNYKAAELAQARNIWNASITDPNSQQMNGEGFAMPVYPLDWTVKQMLRPRRAVPVVA